MRHKILGIDGTCHCGTPAAAGSHPDGAASGGLCDIIAASTSVWSPKLLPGGTSAWQGVLDFPHTSKLSFLPPTHRHSSLEPIHKSALVTKAAGFPLDLQLPLSPPTPGCTFTCSQSLITE